jgi:hypothetical protein
MDVPPFWSGNQDELDRAFKGDETQPSLVEQLLGDVLSLLDLLQQTLLIGARM